MKPKTTKGVKYKPQFKSRKIVVEYLKDELTDTEATKQTDSSKGYAFGLRFALVLLTGKSHPYNPYKIT